MDWIAYILLVLGVIVGMSTLAVYYTKKRAEEDTEMDYRSLFSLGIIFAPIGFVLWILLENPGMVGISMLGIIYLILGIVNRGKWKEEE